MVFHTGLRKKTVAPGASGFDTHLRNPGSTDLFGPSDAVVKHILEVWTRMYAVTNLHVLYLCFPTMH